MARSFKDEAAPSKAVNLLPVDISGKMLFKIRLFSRLEPCLLKVFDCFVFCFKE